MASDLEMVIRLMGGGPRRSSVRDRNSVGLCRPLYMVPTGGDSFSVEREQLCHLLHPSLLLRAKPCAGQVALSPSALGRGRVVQSVANKRNGSINHLYNSRPNKALLRPLFIIPSFPPSLCFLLLAAVLSTFCVCLAPSLHGHKKEIYSVLRTTRRPPANRHWCR